MAVGLARQLKASLVSGIGRNNEGIPALER